MAAAHSQHACRQLPAGLVRVLHGGGPHDLQRLGVGAGASAALTSRSRLATVPNATGAREDGLGDLFDPAFAHAVAAAK